MQIQIDTTLGNIMLELDQKAAPNTVLNFVNYVQDDYYSGTIFHRVINNFMIQAGGLDQNMNEKPSLATIKNEANNGLGNDTGTIAMARTSEPHSASSQFFINTNDNKFLNFRSEDAKGWGYCVFGKVIEGLGVVRKIEAVATTSKGSYSDVPERPVVIKKAILIE